MAIAECKMCAKEFYVKPSHQKLGWGTYCSKECNSAAQRKGKIVDCSRCGKNVYRSQAQIKHSKSNNFFCNKLCQVIWKNTRFVGAKHPNWSGGTKIYRKILSDSNAKELCVCCNISDTRVLVAHHIDHDRKNNTLSNLTWVCLNCHHLIHNYKEFENKFLEKLK